MPTYQYACTACGEGLEVTQRFTDDPLTTCPSCSGKLRKVFSAVGIVFKGSGFYRTDNRSSGSSASTTSPSAKSESNGSSGSGSSDSGSSKSGSESGSGKKEPAAASSSTSSSSSGSSTS
ncbi:FmdB family transcriptional regulator [Sphaerisporangium siamense]|uniref:FmdB family zinc ribbon protein n=1 Tax=Sphaerisporangium siamense TaxID=795645 RepID=UPI00160EB3C5|nr:FmdB family zinc ribbon protein [Sphaerisporangium siamense]GII89560.1 FmdB family transcriptional regulator [Sphaerisporangium siamense]